MSRPELEGYSESMAAVSLVSPVPYAGDIRPEPKDTIGSIVTSMREVQRTERQAALADVRFQAEVDAFVLDFIRTLPEQESDPNEELMLQIRNMKFY